MVERCAKSCMAAAVMTRQVKLIEPEAIHEGNSVTPFALFEKAS
jgi:hypothetical protein